MGTHVLHDRLAGEWIFNGLHSSARFSVKVVVTTFHARFDEFNATLIDGRLTGDAQVASLLLGEDHGFRAHIMAPEFFDAERHPTISFASEQLRLDGDRVEMDGQLTIKGVTRPVHATGSVAGPIDDGIGHTLLGFTLEATVDRTAYGIDWNLDLPGGGKMLADEVKLNIELEFLTVAVA